MEYKRTKGSLFLEPLGRLKNILRIWEDVLPGQEVDAGLRELSLRIVHMAKAVLGGGLSDVWIFEVACQDQQDSSDVVP